MYVWRDGWMEGRMEGWMDGFIYIYIYIGHAGGWEGHEGPASSDKPSLPAKVVPAKILLTRNFGGNSLYGPGNSDPLESRLCSSQTLRLRQTCLPRSPLQISTNFNKFHKHLWKFIKFHKFPQIHRDEFLMSFWWVFGDFLLFYYDRGFSPDEFLMSFWGHFGRSILG